MKIVVLGANGMIGSAFLNVLSEKNSLEVFGTLRSGEKKKFFSPSLAERLIAGCDVENTDHLMSVLSRIRPDVVINCTGLTKHLLGGNNPLLSIPINAMLPHRLTELCAIGGARLIQISSDCVFSGKKGNYLEEDPSDAPDVYGKTKFLGEVHHPSAITLRTSTIGHEFESAYGLLEWFLSQGAACNGFARAVFSGLPTVVLAQVVRDIVIPRPDLTGLYHVVGPAIGKYDLLKLIADVYKKSIEIVRDEQFVIDRSLNGDRFRVATGYVAPEWPELIQTMHAYRHV